MEELLETLEDLTSKKKQIKNKIKQQTELLQKELTEVDDKIKKVKKSIIKQEKLKVNDKSVHILERFIIWNGLKHDNTSWLIEHGPIRDTLFDDGDRHRTYSIVERLDDYLYEYFANNFEADDFPDIEDLYDINLNCRECIKLFDEKLDECQKQEITSLIENAIEMNIDEFTYDWVR